MVQVHVRPLQGPLEQLLLIRCQWYCPSSHVVQCLHATPKPCTPPTLYAPGPPATPPLAPPRYAGIGGMSEVLGWTEVQQQEKKGAMGGFENVLKLVGVVLAADFLLFAYEQYAYMTGTPLPPGLQ